MNLGQRTAAEFLGTFWLVFGGCGTAVFAAQHVGFAGVAAAFGLTVLTGAYTFGHVSGGHFNPAVSIGLWTGGRFAGKDLIPYIIAQVLGAIAAAGILYLMLTDSGKVIGGFATNGFGEQSPEHFGMNTAFIAESVLTFIFLLVIMGSTSKLAPAGFAPIAIGLCLTLIHLISIPITNTSVNPARSISQAVFVGGPALTQLWLFIVAPIVGAVVAGVVNKLVFENGSKK